MSPPNPSPARGKNRRCFATFRFAAVPRFELVYLSPSISRGRVPESRQWRRMETTAGMIALLLGLDDRNVANTSAACVGNEAYPRPLRGLRAIIETITTAGKRLHIHREMEPRHDTYGGIFADWPDPGGTQQPV